MSTDKIIPLNPPGVETITSVESGQDQRRLQQAIDQIKPYKPSEVLQALLNIVITQAEQIRELREDLDSLSDPFNPLDELDQHIRQVELSLEHTDDGVTGLQDQIQTIQCKLKELTDRVEHLDTNKRFHKY